MQRRIMRGRQYFLIIAEPNELHFLTANGLFIVATVLCMAVDRGYFLFPGYPGY